jgi:hypothetical protein
MQLTLAQVRAQIRATQHPSVQRSACAQVGRFYAQGYYMKTDGRFYTTVGGKEYLKYYTGA